MIKVINVVGARPQIIKASAISRAIRSQFGNQIHEILVHTGQHYDHDLSEVFFDELGMPEPDFNLEVGSASHSVQTARIMEGIEKILLSEKPNWVVVYGDTNSTMAAAMAAAKCQVPIVHIEAGLRSFNRTMPEEINRIVTDHVSTLLFSPSIAGFKNLISEGFKPEQSPPYSPDCPKIYHSGDIMYDNSIYFGKCADSKRSFFKDQDINMEKYCLVTIHRENNTDNPERLLNIFDALISLVDGHDIELVLPLHPRTTKAIQECLPDKERRRILSNKSLKILPPVSFLEVILLEKYAKLIMTDSGGVQKEAHFFKKPCLIFRNETEWVELVKNGTSMLVDSYPDKIISGYEFYINQTDLNYPAFYGDGQTASYICNEIINNS